MFSVSLIGIVLAAGKGKRMKSKLYKVLHSVCGKSMVDHVLSGLETLKVDRKVVIVGHGAEAVKEKLGNRAEFVFQAEQLGTGHAVLQTKELLQSEEGTTIVLCGDTPLIRTETLADLIVNHNKLQAAATILTAVIDQPFGYGRIVRNESNEVTAIVEQKDCTSEQALIHEINSGIYCFNNKKLFSALGKITNENAQQEYLLTDVIAILRSEGELIAGHIAGDFTEALGVNDRVGLAEAEAAMRKRINTAHMINGVTFINPDNVYIESDVVIGEDTIIYPGTFLRGNTTIGSDCVIGPDVNLTDTTVEDGVLIKYSVLTQATIGRDSTIGPFAYLRPGSVLGKGVKIGDFVEIKNATIGDGSKVSHLSYVGDATVGLDVNIGCGAITVNYDGFNKHKTLIGDGAFVGSNVNLIAPVQIGDGAYVVAGSTITQDVPSNDLAIARERQSNKPGYAQVLREKLNEKKK